MGYQGQRSWHARLQAPGGPTRTAVPCYAHAGGNDIEALIEDIIRYNEEGYEVIRCQLGAYGGGGFREAADIPLPKTISVKIVFLTTNYILKLFQRCLPTCAIAWGFP